MPASFSFRPPYDFEWQASNAVPSHAIQELRVSKGHGKMQFMIIAPEFVGATPPLPPATRGGGWVRAAVGKLIDPPGGTVMAVSSKLVCGMSWALLAQHAFAHTYAFVGMIVHEVDSQLRVISTPVKWRLTMWDRHIWDGTTPMWGQSHTTPVRDAFRMTPGRLYLVWIWCGGSAAGQTLGRERINTVGPGGPAMAYRPTLAWATSRLIVDLPSIDVTVF